MAENGKISYRYDQFQLFSVHTIAIPLPYHCHVSMQGLNSTIPYISFWQLSGASSDS